MELNTQDGTAPWREGYPQSVRVRLLTGCRLTGESLGVKNCRMNWTIQKPTRDGWYWIRNAASEGWETIVEPQVVHVYGFDDGTPTVSFRPMKCAQTSQR
jgi:hypothetical protein